MQRATFVGRREMRPAESMAARLDGYELRFNLPVGPGQRGVANIVATPGATVYGVVHLIPAADLSRLDRSEGVHRGLYRTASVDVVVADGAAVRAITYLSHIAVTGRLASPRYMGLLLEGAREHGLPEHYVRGLEAMPLAVDERAPTASRPRPPRS